MIDPPCVKMPRKGSVVSVAAQHRRWLDRMHQFIGLNMNRCEFVSIPIIHIIDVHNVLVDGRRLETVPTDGDRNMRDFLAVIEFIICSRLWNRVT